MTMSKFFFLLPYCDAHQAKKFLPFLARYDNLTRPLNLPGYGHGYRKRKLLERGRKLIKVGQNAYTPHFLGGTHKG